MACKDPLRTLAAQLIEMEVGDIADEIVENDPEQYLGAIMMPGVNWSWRAAARAGYTAEEIASMSLDTVYVD